MNSYSYILVDTIPYEGSWIRGVVKNLSDALEYYDKNVKKHQEPNSMSNNELIERALMDNWEIDYYVEVWDNTQPICTFRFNTKMRTLEKEKLKLHEIDDIIFCKNFIKF